jgi:hypothetical protein
MDTSWQGQITPNAGVQFTRLVAIGEAFDLHLPNVVESTDSNHTFVEPFAGGWSLSELCAFTALSHSMSMLVRYHPTRWARLLGHEKGDRLMPVLERMRGLLQSEFIKLVLWELERAEVQSGPV